MYVYTITLDLANTLPEDYPPQKQDIFYIFDNCEGAKLIGNIECFGRCYNYEVELYDVSKEDYDFLEKDIKNPNGLILNYLRDHVKADISLNTEFIMKRIEKPGV